VPGREGSESVQGKSLQRYDMWAMLVGTANETVAATSVVPQASDKMSFVSGSEAASSSARPSIKVGVGQSQDQSQDHSQG
jgi:hypothetical protein